MRFVVWPLLALCAAGCPPRPRTSATRDLGPPQSWRLLEATLEAETESRKERRSDLSVAAENGSPEPAVVASGRIGPTRRTPGRALLCGDSECSRGWSVDNLVLLEIGDAKGRVTSRLAIGFHQGVFFDGTQVVDNAGPMKFSFEPGEVELSDHLPVHEPFTVRATALDCGGVGRVSDLWLRIVPGEGSQPDDEEELRAP